MTFREGKHWLRTIGFVVMATAMLAVVAEAGHRRWARRCGHHHSHWQHNCCAQPYVAHNTCCTSYMSSGIDYPVYAGPSMQQQPYADVRQSQRQPTPSQGIADVPPPPTEGRRNSDQRETGQQLARQSAQPGTRQALRPDFEQSGRSQEQSAEIQELEQQVEDLESQVNQLDRRVRQLQQDRSAGQQNQSEQQGQTSPPGSNNTTEGDSANPQQ